MHAIDRLCLGAPGTRADGPPTQLVKPLPGSLTDVVAAAVDNRPPIADPATGAAYGYRVTGASAYELCAAFDRPRDVDYDPRWNHPAGRHCFGFDLLRPK